MPAPGETALTRLLAGMKPILDPRLFGFAVVQSWQEAARIPAIMQFQEEEGITLIAEHDYLREGGLEPSFPCRMITLSIHSSLEAVGFIAAVSEALTQAGIGTNPVAGFYHDHLFIAEDQAVEAMRVLQALAAQAAQAAHATAE